MGEANSIKKTIEYEASQVERAKLLSYTYNLSEAEMYMKIFEAGLNYMNPDPRVRQLKYFDLQIEEKIIEIYSIFEQKCVFFNQKLPNLNFIKLFFVDFEFYINKISLESYEVRAKLALSKFNELIKFISDNDRSLFLSLKKDLKPIYRNKVYKSILKELCKFPSFPGGTGMDSIRIEEKDLSDFSDEEYIKSGKLRK